MTKTVHVERFLNAAADVARVLAAGLTVTSSTREVRRLVQVTAAAVSHVALGESVELKRLMRTTRTLLDTLGGGFSATNTDALGVQFIEATKAAA